jgi:prepilin-type N-terminal cleavage/methylation domain-containing protein
MSHRNASHPSRIAGCAARHRVRRRGMGLFELMIALAISATLLTAVAVAYQATSRAMVMNEQFARATQAARVSVNQMMSDVRKATSKYTDDLTLEVEVDGKTRRYAYDEANKRLTLQIPDDQPGKTFVLARNVAKAQFYTDDETIAVTLTVEVGSNQVSLSGSAMPRRAINQT